jgi:hypothetical protein
MKVFGRKKCDYIVKSAETGEIFIETVLFNKRFWAWTLEPRIKFFLDKILGPLIEYRDHGYTKDKTVDQIVYEVYGIKKYSKLSNSEIIDILGYPKTE